MNHRGVAHRPTATTALHALTRPRSLAVIGASRDPAKLAGRTIPNLRKFGFKGGVHAVNPRHREIDGVPCVPHVSALPVVPDTAVVLVPASAVTGVLRSLEDLGVPSATVVASGFGEDPSPESQGRLAELEVFLDSARIRILGPNSIGAIDVLTGAVQRATTNLPPSFLPGPVGIVTQSGAMSLILLHRLQVAGVGINQVLPVGNEVDLDVGDGIAHLASLEDTTCIVAFVESIRSARSLARGAAACEERGIHLVAIPAGTSEVGRAVTRGHTGALASDHRLVRELLGDLGAAVVDTPNSAVDVARLATARRRTARGAGVAVLCLSGGEAAVLADVAEASGATLPQPHGTAAATLSGAFRFAAPRNPMDLTADALTDPDLFRVAWSAFAQDERVGRTVIALPPLTAFDRDRILAVTDRLRDADPEVIVVRWPVAGEPAAIGIPDDSAAVIRAHAALALSRRHARPAALLETLPAAGPVAPDLAWLGDEAVRHRASSVGLPWTAEAWIAVEEDIDAAVHSVPGPWVLKGSVAGVPHKIDWGGVLTGLADAVGVRKGFAQLAARATGQFGDAWNGAWLQQTAVGTEAYVGGLYDPRLGPFVALGRGGTDVEQFGDVVFAPIPVDAERVAAMVERTELGRLLRTTRGGPPTDASHLIQTVLAVAALLHENDVLVVDANPVFVNRADGRTTVVDVRIGVRGA